MEVAANQISAPTPCCGNPSSTVTNLLVFLTEALIVSLSRGLIERRFITCINNIDYVYRWRAGISCVDLILQQHLKFDIRIFTSALIPSLEIISAAWEYPHNSYLKVKQKEAATRFSKF